MIGCGHPKMERPKGEEEEEEVVLELLKENVETLFAANK